jgi:hypothetical protein
MRAPMTAPSTSSSAPAPPTAPAVARGSARARWLKRLHQWHWISSAVCLVAMLLFALTGLTLNHAEDIPATPTLQRQTQPLAPELLALLRTPPAGDRAALPEAVAAALGRAFGERLTGREAEWSPQEVYLALPRPGGDAWVRIDLARGVAEHEATFQGWVAYLNDLHKGRHAGLAWRVALDVLAVACLVFTLTGLLLLKLHGTHRPLTWPLVGAGLVLPALVAMFLIH